MLNRPKVMKELQESAQQLFLDISSEFDIARKLWDSVAFDPQFAQEIAASNPPWLIPSWDGFLGTTFSCKPQKVDYTVFSIDGSQIYPDRHQGTSCCLINIGSVVLGYGNHNQVSFDSKPSIYTPNQHSETESPTDMVNCRRLELELKEGVLVAQKLKESCPSNLLCMFDGSLIFWHLEAKDQATKEEYIAKYIYSLHQLYDLSIPCIGYISLPHSKELVNLLRMKLSNFQPTTNKEYKKIEHLLDTHIAQFFLEPYDRTTFFASHSHIIDYYPAHLKPYFFYLHLNEEIVRIELPAWLITNQHLIDFVCQVIIDQSNKGQGYPICLAEAHEQAVVKGPDRDFFYHVIQKIGLEHKQRLYFSQKSLKKRCIGI